MRYDSDSHKGSTRPVRCVWNGGATERELLFNVCRLVFFLLDPVPASGTRRRGPPGRTRSGPGEGRLPAPEVSGCPAGITGSRIDNAATEQVFGHIKDEFFRGRDWDTFEGFKADLEAYIHHWNHVRRQVGLKGLTPAEFREQALREAA